MTWVWDNSNGDSVLKQVIDDYEEKFSKKYKYHQRQGINFVLPKLLQKYCLENKLKLIVLGATKYNKEKVFFVAPRASNSR